MPSVVCLCQSFFVAVLLSHVKCSLQLLCCVGRGAVQPLFQTLVCVAEEVLCLAGGTRLLLVSQQADAGLAEDFTTAGSLVRLSEDQEADWTF